MERPERLERFERERSDNQDPRALRSWTNDCS